MAVLVKIDPRDLQPLAANRNMANVRVRGQSNRKPSIQPSVPGERAFVWAIKTHGGIGLAQRGRISLPFETDDDNDYQGQVVVDAEVPIRRFTQDDVKRIREQGNPGVELDAANQIGSLAHRSVRPLTAPVAEFLENVYAECATDIIGMWRDNTLTETEREVLIRARLRQGQFRTDLLVRWDRQCAVTGCSVEEVLRASHIKPWHCCDNQERLNPENGLLLIANLDVLFDKFLITFDNDGRMLISDRIEEGFYQQLGLPGALRRPPTPGQQSFLEYHREEGEHRGISYIPVPSAARYVT
jgi:hypothetical protein